MIHSNGVAFSQALRTVQGDWGVRVNALDAKYRKHPFDTAKYKDIYVLSNGILLVAYDGKMVSNLIKHRQHKTYGKYFEVLEDMGSLVDTYIVTDPQDFEFKHVSNSSRQSWGRITQVKEYFGVI